ncbi:hypothetical protein [Kaarinaea lacus]
MTTATNFSKQMIGIICTAGMTVINPGNVAQAQEQDSFSPRAYCIQTGGTISETNDPNIYVCVYPARGKGLVINTAISQSLPVNLPITHSRLAQLTKEAFNKSIVPDTL